MTEQEKERGRFWRAAWFLPLLFLLSAGWNIYPAEQRGANVLVWTTNQEMYEGELLKVADADLVLIQKSSFKAIQIDINKIESISIEKKTKNWLHGLGAGLLSGLGAGMLCGIIFNSSEGTTGNLPKESIDKGLFTLFDATSVILSALLGMSHGLRPDSLESKKKVFYFLGKNDLQIKKITAELQLYTRGKYNPYLQKSLLGRFRISWRPFFYPFSRELTLAGQYQPSPYFDRWDHFSLPQRHSQIIWDFGNNPDRSLSFQIDYHLSNWFSLSLDALSLGHYGFPEKYIFFGCSPNRIYYISEGIGGEFGVKAALLSLNVTPPIRKNRPSGLQLELGIGPAFSNFKFISHCEINDVQTLYTTSTSWTSLAYKAGAAWDFTPSSFLSFGLYCNYLYIPATFPGVELSVPNPFTIENGLEFMPLQFRRQKINFGGVLIGALLRFR